MTLDSSLPLPGFEQRAKRSSSSAFAVMQLNPRTWQVPWFPQAAGTARATLRALGQVTRRVMMSPIRSPFPASVLPQARSGGAAEAAEAPLGRKARAAAARTPAARGLRMPRTLLRDH
jgi:hypothetical protein